MTNNNDLNAKLDELTSKINSLTEMVSDQLVQINHLKSFNDLLIGVPRILREYQHFLYTEYNPHRDTRIAPICAEIHHRKVVAYVKANDDSVEIISCIKCDWIPKDELLVPSKVKGSAYVGSAAHYNSELVKWFVANYNEYIEKLRDAIKANAKLNPRSVPTNKENKHE